MICSRSSFGERLTEETDSVTGSIILHQELVPSSYVRVEIPDRGEEEWRDRSPRNAPCEGFVKDLGGPLEERRYDAGIEVRSDTWLSILGLEQPVRRSPKNRNSLMTSGVAPVFMVNGNTQVGAGHAPHLERHKAAKQPALASPKMGSLNLAMSPRSCFSDTTATRPCLV